MKIVFMGTPDFSVPVLQKLIQDGYEVVAVVTQPDKPVGRKKVITPPPVKREALRHEIPVLQPKKVRHEYKEILDYKPDLIVTAAYGQILPSELLEGPKLGCINVHASLLPEYRGGAPIHKAIIDGKKESGITIMYMVNQLDAGDILTQVRVPIDEDDHVGSLHDKLSIAGAKLLSETIPKLIANEIEPKKQEESLVTYAPNISREMEEINWELDGETIYNQIRGLHPWPVAYTTLNGKPLKVWWGHKVNAPKKGLPGQLVHFDREGIVVATGNETAIRISELQPAGKKRMQASQFVAGAQLSTDMKLGEKE
ncbi:methionyl-tRNA formyltransferase [Pseudalkalibacillus berkeleyi]|uniref:Methionyl-tRNA formyltransferase n=1 Tax=Pseudalkalibacillus berkeleyi TaxID=1069813 RepID=A0ABS9GZI0_9BACL|nr:methionyl-tRNA formyltransferase [Pseudalkalibacillus berkeleyi]MCF6137054.1 methionyl-tRNA formyltransferase [Pseudalkalibacillus berkeleyi]